jgi:hypothetical protein
VIHRLNLPLELVRQPHFDRAIVVFQSDDWGHSCVPSRTRLEAIWSAARASVIEPWACDAQESLGDIEALGRVLAGFKDCDGCSPCFTLNFIVHEPAYELIEKSGFTRYDSRPHVQADVASSVRMLTQRFRVFEPALHGAEHIEPGQWLAHLRSGDRPLRAFFDQRAMPPPALVARYRGLGAAYLSVDDAGTAVAPPWKRIEGAAHTFERLFGERPRGFVAPNHAWEPKLEEVLGGCGVDYLQAAHYHYRSRAAFESGTPSRHRAGARGRAGLRYQTRTVDFEPAVRPDAVAHATQRACLLAERGIPVVVNSHRINYVRGIDEGAAARSLDLLQDFIRALTNVRPDICFETSASLDKALRGEPHRAKRIKLAPLQGLATDLALAAWRTPSISGASRRSRSG